MEWLVEWSRLWRWKIARGCLFEIYVRYIFRKGGHTFEIKKLEGNHTSQLQIPDNPTVQPFKKSSELSAATVGKLFLPTIPNFPCLDLYLAPDKLFQVTVSSDHPIKQKHLNDIVKNIIGNTNRELRLYFVVPNEIYSNFKTQNYLTDTGSVSQAVPIVVTRNVKQYALKFDLNAAYSGGSPGVGDGTAYWSMS